MHWAETPHSQKDYVSLTILYKFVNQKGWKRAVNPDRSVRGNSPEPQGEWFAWAFLANLTKCWKKRSFTQYSIP